MKNKQMAVDVAETLTRPLNEKFQLLYFEGLVKDERLKTPKAVLTF